MDIQAEKYYLIEELMKVQDINLVNEIKTLLLKRNKAVAYNSTGEPITTSQMQSDILAAKERIKSGKYTRQEDLKSEVEGWE